MAERLSHYTQLCERVMNLDKSIRFAGVISDRGRLVAGGMREGVKPLEKEKDDEVLFMELALRVRMRREFDRQLGPVNFAMASRRRAITMSFRLNNNILYVAAEPDADYCTLPRIILDLIKQLTQK
ncbi:MAG: hypothetical protein F4Y82_05365 [Cenarchaeum sp. SB0665_bin_23]|nr:hypothetical protein [Cenarchaeum sp. SB0667_bin_13]MXY61520.1 hypothetical protein [Cenarchaeum sp. SB0665_bin_23]MXZ93331.1 hypothetical protein [Cenarchaeum sp. SB0666_bin_15]MYB46309.1 hypothetical protein [Cenarchaeum sp. SB0662_bin_33]MYC79396.1 hypothetical protein [Cenarchaeum sp. SB0661_bin_35]MYG33038.1 hypothetical protein [Cenarchaeum sp. SB0677_bin_16]MYJ28368.1 hypothetical protein [Cenarchaeum sp. SB0672_bin_9]